MRLLVLTAAAAALLACASAAHASNGFFDVEKLPPPPVTGEQIAEYVETFSTTYSARATGTPGEQEAAEFLRAEAASLGYQAEIVEFPVQGPEPVTVLRAVVAVKQGLTHPDEHLIFMGHYDTVAGYGGATLDGAYDNASGTSMIRALARSLADAPTNRTLMFVFYNGEEEGLLTSERHAAQFAETGKPVRGVLGFDMTGIGYPVASPGPRSCLCIWHGDEDEGFEPLLRHVNYGLLDFPEEENLVSIVGVNERNSDESSWDRLGFRSLRWAGMRAAADYPAYHMPNDTIATIEQVAGGREFFAEGLRNTLVSSYMTALALDNEMPVARAAATPAKRRTVSFDASGSGDPDGTPGALEWSFGDGTTGTGLTASHTYAKPGDYVATLTVRDNLWSQVTATAAVPVHVAKPPKARRKRAKSCRTRRARRTARCRRAAHKRKLDRVSRARGALAR